MGCCPDGSLCPSAPVLVAGTSGSVPAAVSLRQCCPSPKAYDCTCVAKPVIVRHASCLVGASVRCPDSSQNCSMGCCPDGSTCPSAPLGTVCPSPKKEDCTGQTMIRKYEGFARAASAEVRHFNPVALVALATVLVTVAALAKGRQRRSMYLTVASSEGEAARALDLGLSEQAMAAMALATLAVLKLQRLRLQELSGASAEGKASWIALVQRELEKDACPEARRPEVIACLRPPKAKMRLQGVVRTRLPRMSTNALPYIGRKISLVSNSELRYEGILYTINTQSASTWKHVEANASASDQTWRSLCHTAANWLESPRITLRAWVFHDGSIAIQILGYQMELFRLGVLSLLISAAAVNVNVQHLRGTHFTGRLQSEFPFYHTTKELQSEAKRLVSSCKASAKMQTVQKDYVSIDEIRVKAAASNSTTANSENRVSLLFGEHSRELIGPETGLMLLKMLCGDKTTEKGMLDEALKDSEFQLILNANPFSRIRVERGEYCLRENPNGVDLNRNWDEKWDLGTENSAEQSHGKRPFSEPETQLVRDLISDFKPTTFLSVHSGTLGLYMPWAYDSQHLAERNRAAMLSVLKDLDEAHCKCPFGAAGLEVGYDCPGTSFDWVFDHLKAPFSFAWEIYANPSEGEHLRKRWEDKLASMKNQKVSLLQSKELSDLYADSHSDFWSSMAAKTQHECFSNFNPGTEEEYNVTVTNWATSYLNLAIKTAPLVKKANKD
eukprot:s892_g13.t1